MNPEKIVITAGCLCLDIIPNLEELPRDSFQQLFRPGRVVMANAAHFTTGGAVSNTGLALHQLGVPTKLIAKIGDDHIGQIIINLIKDFSEQLIDNINVDKESPSSYSVVISPPGTDRIFIHCPGTNDHFSSKDIQPGLFENAALFHFGYPTVMRQLYLDQGRDLVEMFRRVKAVGVTTSLDMTLPDPTSESGSRDWKSILSKTLPYVDIFMPSLEELLFFMRRDLFDQYSQTDSIIDNVAPDLLSEISDDLLEMGAKIVLVKMGSSGLYFRSGSRSALKKMGKAQPRQLELWADKELWTPCFKVDVVGTTGAGDVTIAGFLGGLLREMTPEKTILSAVAVGACSVEGARSLGTLKTWEKTQTRIENGWERLPAAFDVRKWSCEKDQGVWEKITSK